ncbi:hypothetical protein O181_132387 [Austropuccinia psidii MF-1]|uniref:Uncharacterized protein n=1 Tax=Austropuccinia psidii MF-1 TaxID=1389203 RepID=A0A9Q3QDV4_9BASI|nr:hypothetical protein [Austropuccinia psidii MF-1]
MCVFPLHQTALSFPELSHPPNSFLYVESLLQLCLTSSNFHSYNYLIFLNLTPLLLIDITMSSNAMGVSPSAFHRENSGSSSQNPPTEGDSIIKSDEGNHKSIHTNSTGQKSIFLQDLERLGIEDAVAQNASQE